MMANSIPERNKQNAKEAVLNIEKPWLVSRRAFLLFRVKPEFEQFKHARSLSDASRFQPTIRLSVSNCKGKRLVVIASARTLISPEWWHLRLSWLRNMAKPAEMVRRGHDLALLGPLPNISEAFRLVHGVSQTASFRRNRCSAGASNDKGSLPPLFPRVKHFSSREGKSDRTLLP